VGVEVAAAPTKIQPIRGFPSSARVTGQCDAAGLQEDGRVAQRQRALHVLFDHQNREPAARELAQQREDLLADDRREPGDLELLLLPARQRGRLRLDATNVVPRSRCCASSIWRMSSTSVGFTPAAGSSSMTSPGSPTKTIARHRAERTGDRRDPFASCADR
jgi:hypothetical protein